MGQNEGLKGRKIAIILIVVSSFLLVIGTAISFAGQGSYLEVSFDTDGGESLQSVSLKKGEKLKNLITPSKAGYQFLYWSIDGQPVDENYIVEENVKLVAVWQEDTTEENSEENSTETVTEYTVTFDSDGGSFVFSQKVKENEKVIKPTDPTKKDYTFKEWTLDGISYNFDDAVTKDITLKATWQENKKEENPNTNSTTGNSNNNNTNTNNDNATPSTPQEKKYKVTFDSNGGSSVASQTVKEGGKATKPADPTRNGYTFTGWYLNGKAYNFSTVVKSNITLVAKWTKNAASYYTVTFDSNGGSSVSPQTLIEGTKATQPSNPTKGGYNFSGWYLNGSQYNFNSAVTSNITLIAHWTAKVYTVGVTRADAYSPDSILTVYEDGRQITVQSINYSDGTYLCSGSNATVLTGDIEGVTSFLLVLSDGTRVTAALR